MSRPPREFNYDLATPTQVLEEADRRCRNRLAGRNPTDDGPPTTPSARSIERAERAIEFARCMLTPVPPSFEDMRAEARAAAQRDADALAADHRTELTLCLPWSHLLSDNAKYAPALTKQRRATMILTMEYRTAKRRAMNALTAQMAGLPPLKGPVTMLAVLWEPSRSRRRDLTNLSKLVQDAMNGIAYTDDSYIDDVRWVRAGVDVDLPRLELTITPRKAQ